MRWFQGEGELNVLWSYYKSIFLFFLKIASCFNIFKTEFPTVVPCMCILQLRGCTVYWSFMVEYSQIQIKYESSILFSRILFWFVTISRFYSKIYHWKHEAVFLVKVILYFRTLIAKKCNRIQFTLAFHWSISIHTPFYRHFPVIGMSEGENQTLSGKEEVNWFY